MLRDHGRDHRHLQLCQIPDYKGSGAADWLNAVFANTMPKSVGRSCLTPLISKTRGDCGGFHRDPHWTQDEFMGYRLRYGRTVSQTVLQCRFPCRTMELFSKARPRIDLRLSIVAGPKSRDLLQRLTNAHHWTTADFPLHAVKADDRTRGRCRSVALRVSFTGDLGWELHCKTEDQARALCGPDRSGQGVSARVRCGAAR